MRAKVHWVQDPPEPGILACQASADPLKHKRELPKCSARDSQIIWNPSNQTASNQTVLPCTGVVC